MATPASGATPHRNPLPALSAGQLDLIYRDLHALRLVCRAEAGVPPRAPVEQLEAAYAWFEDALEIVATARTYSRAEAPLRLALQLIYAEICRRPIPTGETESELRAMWGDR